jgi:hypothetical protein
MNPGNDEARYSRSLTRITRWIVLLGVVGAVYLGFAKGLRFAGGFLLGCTASWLSFWRWSKVAESLGSSGSNGRGSVRWIIRFLAVAGVAYVIVKYLEVNVVAALAGLLVAAAAVVFEIVFQLIDPRA